MHSADIKAIAEAYQSIYAQKEIVELTEKTVDLTEDLTEELLDESFGELVDELIEEGYSEEEAIEIVDEATDLYIDSVLCEVSDSYYDSAVRASKKAARGIDKAARQKRRAGQVRYAKRKAGEALSAVKAKAKGAVAGAQIAGSIAKDEARRAGRKAAHSVTSAPGKAKAAVSRKKDETKRGIKGFIKRQAEKLVKRMSEEVEALKATGKFTEAEIAAFASVEEGYKEISFDKHQRMYDRYKKLRSAAVQDARDSGEASGTNRMKMGKMSAVIDKSSENLRKKQTKDQLTGRG